MFLIKELLILHPLASLQVIFSVVKYLGIGNRYVVFSKLDDTKYDFIWSFANEL